MCIWDVKMFVNVCVCVWNVRMFACVWDMRMCVCMGCKDVSMCIGRRGGGLGSRPKKMYGERLRDGVEYHLMSPTPRR